MMVLPAMNSLYSTFVASLRSVGTAVTMAAVGVYLHETGCIKSEGKRTLAVLSQQVTFPLFLFTKIIYCNQDWSNTPCPDITRSLEDVWMLLFWPLYVVGVGLIVGAVVAKLSDTPKHQVPSVLAACALGNATGLPITLLNVIHSNFPVTSDLGRIDPTLFLSVYLLLYPVLQWGLGGWLLAPEPIENDDENTTPTPTTLTEVPIKGGFDQISVSESLRHNVVNNKSQDDYYKQHHHGLASSDEGLYMTEVDLPRLLREAERAQLLESMRSEDTESPPHSGNYEGGNSNGLSIENGTYRSAEIPTEDIPLLRPPLQSEQQPVGVSCGHFDTESLWQTAKNILDRCFQPPVVGALAGIFCAVTPLRGVFVDLVSRNSDAPLQWFFDGLYAVGQTAVPTNMLILGCNLSSSQYTVAGGQNYKSSGLLTTRSMIGIVIGKMIVMPIIGILSGWILKTYFWHIPDDIDGSFYLVLMIVFLTPTANNVMIIVELSGSGAKEGIARVIALQYAVAPVILSLTMTIAIGVASGWSS